MQKCAYGTLYGPPVKLSRRVRKAAVHFQKAAARFRLIVCVSFAIQLLPRSRRLKIGAAAGAIIALYLNCALPNNLTEGRNLHTETNPPAMRRRGRGQ